MWKFNVITKIFTFSIILFQFYSILLFQAFMWFLYHHNNDGKICVTESSYIVSFNCFTSKLKNG